VNDPQYAAAFDACDSYPGTVPGFCGSWASNWEDGTAAGCSPTDESVFGTLVWCCDP
jgi:hypothetical protein